MSMSINPGLSTVDAPHESTSPLHKIWTAKPLELGAAGDVVAARRIVEILYESFELPPPDEFSMLLLTAACLQLSRSPGEEPYLGDLTNCLIDLATQESARTDLCTSPLSLVQYAGMEMQAMDDVGRTRILAPLIAQTSLIPQPASNHPRPNDRPRKSK